MKNLDLFLYSLPENVKSFIMQDIPRWQEVVKKSQSEDDPFMFLWNTRQEFRSLIRYRLRIAQKLFNPEKNLVNELIKITGNGPNVYVTNLYISCQDIGSGFYIEHGFSSIIYAKKIGKNFWVNQNVTIGTGKGGNPSIGDEVRVGANSVIIGNINVSDNVRLGAGAVLNFEVPAGSTVVNQKCRVIPPAEEKTPVI